MIPVLPPFKPAARAERYPAPRVVPAQRARPKSHGVLSYVKDEPHANAHLGDGR